MKIAYFSPLNPLKSGVSDYSEELLPYLAHYMEVDLYVDGYTLTNKELGRAFNVYNIDQYDHIAASRNYDASVYHIGNSSACHERIYRHALEHPGIVVMHDYSLHHLLAEITVARKKSKDYLAEMEYCHGEKGRAAAQAFLDGKTLAPWETSAMTYPLNKRIIDSAKGIIAHSYFTRNRIKSQRLDVLVRRVNFHALEIAEDPIESYKAARKALGIADGEIIVASFGFVVPSKRIDKLLAAVARLCKEGYRFKYYVVGGELGPNLEREIKNLGIPKGVVVSTGFLGLDEGFLLYMRATNIGCNLRYPVSGETSSTLHRLLGMGKPVLVSNAGSFQEYPDQACMKINVTSQEEEEIYESLRTLLEDEERRWELGRAAYTFAQENLSVERLARDYYDFIAGVAHNRLKYEALIEHLAHGLVASGLDENETLVKELSESIARLPYR